MIKNEDIEKLKKDILLKPLNSKEELRDWVWLFFDLYMPLGYVSDKANSSAVDAMWEVYNAVKTNTGDVVPGYTLLSSRDSYKTISASILEVLLLIHFRLTIAHTAAQKNQAFKAVEYHNDFLNKIMPYLSELGWKRTTQNKMRIELSTDKGEVCYIQVIVLTMNGANSAHTNFVTVDEVDLCSPKPYQEAKLIGGVLRGRFPITLRLSTRKFNFGIMQMEIDRAHITNEKVLQWNILDVTQYCPPSRCKPQEKKVIRYIPRELPMGQMDEKTYLELEETERDNYEKIEAFSGCVACPLLSVCKTKLHTKKTPSMVGDLWKPIEATINVIKAVDPDVGEAQLLCFGPETQILMGTGSAKSISSVVEGDTVITHKGNVRNVTKVFKREYKGVVYKVENHAWKRFPETIVTPEHPYFLNGKEFKPISEMQSAVFKWKCFKLAKMGDYASLPINYEISPDKEISYTDYVEKETTVENGLIRIKGLTGKRIPTTYPLDYDFGWIVGYFLAEGFFAKDKRNVVRSGCFRSAITFCSDVRETEYHEKIRAFATKLDLTTSEFKSKSSMGYTVDIYNKTLCELFAVLCGEKSDQKRLHPKLMNSNLDFLKGVLDGFDDGDGTKKVIYFRELTTCSYTLSSQLFLIAARLGLSPRLTKLTRKDSENGKPRQQPYRVYYVNVNRQQIQNRTRFKVENGYNQYRVDKIEKAEYEGLVYNIEVDGDNSYIANGVAVHNCNKPSTAGLIYPRFEIAHNVLSVQEAWEMISGGKTTSDFKDFISFVKSLGVTIEAGVDFGYTNQFAIIVGARLTHGICIILDKFTAPGLELTDCVRIAKDMKEKYSVQRFWCDTAYPSYIKTFNKNNLVSPSFEKDVARGISAVRERIVDGSGTRKFFILDTPNNASLIKAMGTYHWKLDAQGTPTDKPDHTEESDEMDALRYLMDNMFGIKNKVIFSTVNSDKEVRKPKIYKNESLEQMAQETNKTLMQEKMQELVPEGTEAAKKNRTSKKILWM
jgi:intein/homing endonuclease